MSRKDQVGNEVVTTFDVRMKLPNREPALHQGAIHTIEHLAATFLRNHDEWKERIVYWGPMGCLTGNYLIVKGDLTSNDVLPLMQETFAFIANYEGEIPGATERDCGNYLCKTCPWLATKLTSISPKRWTALRKIIWTILLNCNLVPFISVNAFIDKHNIFLHTFKFFHLVLKTRKT